MKARDQKWNIGGHFSLLRDREEGWTEGCVFTPHGIVDAYAQGCGRHTGLTKLDFIKDGVCHSRFFDKRYTKRGIVTKAKQFAKEVSEG